MLPLSASNSVQRFVSGVSGPSVSEIDSSSHVHDRYRGKFEKLRGDLFNLGNPYLLSFICERLKALCGSDIDVSNPGRLKAHFNDARLPSDFKETFMRFAELLCEFATVDLSVLCTAIMSGSLVDGDIVAIETTIQMNKIHPIDGIAPGKYVVRSPEKIAGGVLESVVSKSESEQKGRAQSC